MKMNNKVTEKANHFSKSFLSYLILAVSSAIIFLCALRFGSADMTFSQFLSALLRKEGYETKSIILYEVRLPRILAGIIAGVGLAVSGVLLQSITDNSLASPNIIGVNSGAGFAAVLTLSLFPGISHILPLFAFIGALLATITIVTLSEKVGNSKSTIILAGIALSSLLNAGISALTLIDTDVLASYNAFSIGGFRGITYDILPLPAIIIAISTLVCIIFSRQINLMCLGEKGAASLGVNVKLLRLLCIICASACAASAVSFAGLLGFVGLVVPHIARKFTGNKTFRLIIFSIFIGADITVLADLLGRIILRPSEIPVGIMMAFVGAPFFIVLLFKSRKAY